MTSLSPKPIALAVSALLCLTASLPQNVRAQGTLVEQGTATLADVTGTASGPEALTISWSVFLNSAVYTYSYIVNNPSGDVGIGSQNNGQPETVDTFQVSFNAANSLLYNPGTASGGIGSDAGSDGITWLFSAVNPGSSSPALPVQTSEGPTITGDAQASDSNPPSPWSSSPDGTQLAIPAPEPSSAVMLGMAAVGAFFWRILCRQKRITEK